jgi:DNA end-binding protein Ku
VNGSYVVLEDQELDALEEATSRTIDVVAFVDAAKVSSLYLETSFYVTPQEDTERAYEVLLRHSPRPTARPWSGSS